MFLARRGILTYTEAMDMDFGLLLEIIEREQAVLRMEIEANKG